MKIKHDSSTVICNFLRHVALTERAALRPVAFTVGNSSSLLSAGDLVVEDMLTFNRRLTEVNYIADSDAELIVVSLSCNDKLHYSDFSKSGVKAVNAPASPLLNLISGPIEVKIYFRLASGSKSKDDNCKFLEENGFDTDYLKLTVLSSRHTDITKFCWSIEESLIDLDEVKFDIETVSGHNTASVLAQTVDQAVNLLQRFCQNL